MQLASCYRAVMLALVVLLPIACTPQEKQGGKKDVKTGPEPEVKVEDLVEGKGEPVKVGDFVEVYYTGWLTDETKFDSNVDRQDPLEFRVGSGGVIKGWHKGIVGMKAGGKRRLTIPPELAYGKEGRPPTIPGNATLIFEVDLLRVKR